MSKGLLILSGPSGSGKSTLIKRLFKEYPNSFSFSVSHTTRSPRPGETPDVDYHYTDKQTFQKMIENEQFLEYTQFSTNYYGTSWEAVRKVGRDGKICVLDVDRFGIQSLQKTTLGSHNNGARYICIMPPSLEELRNRLQGRGTESQEMIEKRLSNYEEDLKFSQTGVYDLILVNEDLETTYQQFKSFILQAFQL